MKILLLLALFSLPSLAQDPIEVLKAATKVDDPLCAPEVAGGEHCLNFHSAGCEEKSFQPDGTGEKRTKAQWEEKLSKGKAKILPALTKALNLAYQTKIKSQDWTRLATDLGLAKTCHKFPVSKTCALQAAGIEAQRVIASETRPNKDQQQPFDLDPGVPLNERLGLKPVIDAQRKILLDSIRFKKDEDRMLSMVSSIKDGLKAKISSMVTDPDQKIALLKKLDDTSFKGFECGDNDLLRSYSLTGAFNTKTQDGKNEITYCAGNFRENGSAFNLAYLLAHEFAHSIDPCNFRAKDTSKMDREFLEAQHPFSKIITCLRSTDSVGASWDEDFYKENLPNHTLCQQDQIGESFSDWMAAEVVPGYMQKAFPNLTTNNYKEGFLNVSRTLKCGLSNPALQGDGVSAHPEGHKRINKIMMGNPAIKQLVGCGAPEAKPVHCSNSTDLTTLAPPNPYVKKTGFTGIAGVLPGQSLKSSSDSHEACFGGGH